MTTASPSGNENTYVFDTEGGAEMARLITLDQVTTKGMGGPVTGLPDLAGMQAVLDIACGPGGWVLDIAHTYPQLEVAGIDISQTMIAYANARALTQKRTNASFGMMDARSPLDFSDSTFDLVNARLITSFMPRDTWLTLLKEVRRVLRPGGTFRITETDSMGVTTSRSYDALNVLLMHAMQIRGYGFSSDGRSLGSTPVLARLLRQAGFQDIRQIAHAINFSAGEEAWTSLYHNAEIIYKQSQPLLIALGLTAQEEVEQLYQAMQAELQDEEFCGIWYLLSATGVNPV